MRVFQQVEAKLLVGSRRHVNECAAAGHSIASLNLEDLAQVTGREPALPLKVELGRD